MTRLLEHAGNVKSYDAPGGTDRIEVRPNQVGALAVASASGQHLFDSGCARWIEPSESRGDCPLHDLVVQPCSLSHQLNSQGFESGGRVRLGGLQVRRLGVRHCIDERADLGDLIDQVPSGDEIGEFAPGFADVFRVPPDARLNPSSEDDR